MKKNLLLSLVICVNVSYALWDPSILGQLDPDCTMPYTTYSTRDYRIYERILQQWASDGTKLYYSPKRYWQWSLLDSILPSNIDSAVAIDIAVMAAAEHYDFFKMVPLGARLMGNDKRHWLVFCIANVYPDPDVRRWKIAYKIWKEHYEKGRLSCLLLGNKTPLVTILISRENGQVLKIMKNMGPRRLKYGDKYLMSDTNIRMLKPDTTHKIKRAN